MDKTVGMIAAVTGAAIVYLSLNYGPRMRPKTPETDGSGTTNTRLSLHETIYKCRYYSDKAVTVTHMGSCHCQRIRFQLKAPAEIVAVDIPSKIRFPRLTAPCANFELLSDQRDCSLYSVTSSAGGDQGIHTFCSYCGVHILYAPTVDPIMVHVNVDCLSPDNIKSLSVAYHDVLETVPAASELGMVHENNVRFNRRGSGSVDLTLQTSESNGGMESIGTGGRNNVVSPPASADDGSNHPVVMEGPFSGRPSPFHAAASAATPTFQHNGYNTNAHINGHHNNNNTMSGDDIWTAVAEGFCDNSDMMANGNTPMAKRYSTFTRESMMDT